MHRKSLLTLVLGTVALAGCVDDSESVTPSPIPGTPEDGFVARFHPLAGIVPFPNDLFFQGSLDGTLNLPAADPTDLGDPLVAISHLDGYSTTAAMHVRFTDSLGPASLVGGATVHVFEVDIDPTTTATVGFRAVLLPGVDYSVGVAPSSDTGGSVLQITPLRPLDSGLDIGTGLNVGYLVLITDGVTDASGTAAAPDDAYAAILTALATGGSTGDATLDGIAQLVGAHLAIGTAVLGDTSDVILSFSFTTQDPDVVMETVAATAAAGTTTTVGPTGLTIADVLDPDGSLGVAAIADVHVGTITLPYYSSLTDPINGYWQDATGGDVTRYSPVPASNGDVTIPVMAVVPNAAAGFAFGCAQPGGGWPVVVFQHGITQDRTNLLALGQALAAACHVGIAIDLPLHGITDDTNPFYVAGLERTFDLDLDGTAGIDGSGTYFLNPLALLTTRDNFRQAAADIVVLGLSAGSIDLDGDMAADLDGSDLHFVGHSMGGILGGIAMGVDTNIGSASLMNAGASWQTMLVDSETIGAAVLAGLAEVGIFPGTQFFLEFLRNAQTVVDAGDPLNYAAAAATNHPIHLVQVADDATVPNSATAIMASAMGLTTITGTTVDGAGVRGFVRITEGGHGSFLDPTDSLAATTEMQTQMSNFAGSDGTAIVITDASVVDATP